MADTTALGRRPVTLLQALMRERHLTREQTVELLDRRARQMGVHDFTLSLRQLDRWLAQDVGDPRSVRCRVAEAEFGYQIERLLSPAHPHGIVRGGGNGAASPLEHYSAIVSHLAQIDHQAGASSALGPATAICRSTLEIVDQSRGPDRDECLRLAARCSELVGWFHDDAGSPGKARQWTAKALDLAEAADAHELVPYILMRRSVVAAELGQADEALLLAESSLRRAHHDTDRALALRGIAVAHALKGNEPAFRRAVEAAVSSLGALPDPGGLAPYCTSSYVLSEAGSAALVLGDTRLAVEYLETAAAGWPAGQRRDEAVCLARLALAHGRNGDLGRAESMALRASDAAVGCGSTRFDQTLKAAIDIIEHTGGGHQAFALADRLPSLA